MIDPKIESFLEKEDMNYLFCLLSKLEAGRLSQLPTYVRNRLGDKFSVLSMRHVAENEVPDYISEIAEAELEAEAQNQARKASDLEDGSDLDLGEETFDDSIEYTDEPKPEAVNPFGTDEDEDEEFFDDSDDFYDNDTDDEEDDD